MREPAAPLSGVFGLPPGADFPAAFATGLRARLGDAPPEALARCTVFVNSGRMARRVRAALVDEGPCLLPRIRLVSDLADFDRAVRPPLAPRLDTVMGLAALVTELIDRLPDLAPRAATLDLATGLADLLDEMGGEGVPVTALSDLDVGTHAAHWQRSRAIVEAAAAHFGAGAESRRRAIVADLARDWAVAPLASPVIVAGSTGSRGATCALMEAVARLPQGVLVLPGYDFDMAPEVWAQLDRGLEAEDHPQFRFRALLDGVGRAPSAVQPWAPDTAPDPARNRLISLALRPAPVTDAWRREGTALPDPRRLTAGLTLLEAPDPSREAAALALCLRQALETGQRVALITPDRGLSRRVEAALDPWRLIADDSAGVPLNETAPGRLLRQIAAIGADGGTLSSLLALFKHPLVASGDAMRGPHLRHVRELELYLRRRRVAHPHAAAVQLWAADREDRGGWVAWAVEVLSAAPPGTVPLAAQAGWLRHLAEHLAGGPPRTGTGALWDGAAGRAAAAALADLEGTSAETPLDGRDFARLLDGHLGAETVTRPELPRADLMIWGTLEARAQGADLVVLAGLNEGVWPASPAPDPWLNRQMRADLGLLLPERQIGLAAHDFQQAVAAPVAVLSRALRDDEAETVPSRWVNRLTNLLAGLDHGPEALKAMRARGRALLDLATVVAEPMAEHLAAPAVRPAPSPPVDMRPRELPVTAITTLNRDPYAVYARRILGLKPLDPLVPVPDARIRGTALHRTMTRFLEARANWTDDDGSALALLDALAAEELGRATDDLGVAAFWRARFAVVSPRIVAGERTRLAAGVPVWSEAGGGVALPDLALRLTARPDRIDRLTDGTYAVYDYKTSVPTTRQVDSLDKQLVLEAALLERGGFEGLNGPVARMAYIPLGAHDRTEAEIGLVDKAGARRPDVAWAELQRVMAAYGQRETGYPARRAPEQIRFEGDYDHLARYGEWSTSDEPVLFRVGPDEPA